MTTRVAAGVKRHAATEQALRQAWERLRAGAPTHPKLVDGDGQLSISAVCLEAGCSRNALYDGHPELLDEIRQPSNARGARERKESVTSGGHIWTPNWLAAAPIGSGSSPKTLPCYCAP